MGPIFGPSVTKGFTNFRGAQTGFRLIFIFFFILVFVRIVLHRHRHGTLGFDLGFSDFGFFRFEI